MCIEVSKVLPFHRAVEYPKNCIKSLILQNIPSPRDILLPRLVSINSVEDVRPH